MNDEAITLCRVSTKEQRLSHSLTRQDKSVIKAAEDLGVNIVKTISGDISSKVGRNFARPDLMEAFEYAKTHLRVRYLIVDEVDRFMRSVGEMFYWITKFQQEAGVTVYFASNPELNTNDARSRLLLSLDGFKAEGSNEERQKKSISGHENAIAEGRYTFPPKAGYIKGSKAGEHLACPECFIPLQTALKEVVSGIYNPRETLSRLNDSSFKNCHSQWRMDKFRNFLLDPFYAGIIEVNKQVNARNENGKYPHMISIAEHEKLKAMLDGSVKPREPKRHYNPEFPMNNSLWCEDCGEETKFTGSRKNNGFKKKTTRYYYKYRCRGCKKEYHRTEVHNALDTALKSIEYTGHQKDEFLDALRIVWEEKRKDARKQIESRKQHLLELEELKTKLVVEMTNAKPSLKADYEQAVDETKGKILETKKKLSDLVSTNDDLVEFIEFGIDYSGNMLQKEWWELEPADRAWCQTVFFPGGISYGTSRKVSTHNLSPIYRLMTKEKDSQKSLKTCMVELPGTAPGSEK